MCKDTVFVTIEASTNIIMVVESDGTTCDEDNGTITPTIIFSNGEVTYTLDGQPITLPIESLSPGNYIIEATDEDGCTSSELVTINSSQNIDIAFTPTHTTCDGENGEITASVIFSNGTINYTLDGNSESMPVAGLDTGTYTVIATDEDGCNYPEDITINPSQNIDLSYTTTPTTCTETNGEIDVNVIFSNGMVSYTIDAIPTTLPIVGLSAGSYVLQAEDEDGCSTIQTVTVDALDALDFTLSSIHTTCGEDNGGATITINSGEEPVTFTLDGDPVTFPVSDLAAGSYDVVGTDANGCPQSATLTINPSQDIEVSYMLTHTTCAEENGMVDAIINFSIGAVSYTLDGSDVTMPVSGLAPGVYTLIATDEDGCSSTEMVTIDESQDISVSFLLNHTTCGEDNGGLDVTILNSNGTVTYTVNGNPATIPVSGLSPGQYSVMAMDEDGCQVFEVIIINPSQDIDVTFNPTHTTCNIDNGAIDAAVSFSNGTVNYSLDGNAVSLPFNNLAPGTYSLAAVDEDGCTYTEMIAINPSQDIDVSYTPTHTTCAMDNGMIDATINFSNGVVTYTLEGTTATLPVSGLASGTYAFIATDADGCSAMEMVEVNPSQDISVAFIPTATTCNEDNGSLDASVNFGNGAITYTVNGTIVSLPLVQLAAGTYTVEAADEDGCSYSDIVTIEGSNILEFSLTPTTTTCNEDNGSIDVSIITAVEPVIYTDGNGSPLTFPVTNLAPGTYIVNGEDADGCTFTTSATIAPSEILEFNLIGQDAYCEGATGEIDVTFVSGVMPFTYTINGTSTSMPVLGLTASTYTIEGTDADGCLYSDMITINTSDPLTFTLTAFSTTCDMSNGSIDVNFVSGTAPVTYTLDGTIQVFPATGLAPGTYTVGGTDAFGCVFSATSTIDESDILEFSTSVTPATCDLANGDVTATLITGALPVTYSLTGFGSNTSGVFTGLVSGSYILEGLDNDGCLFSTSFTIESSNTLEAELIVDRTYCGEDNGEILVNIISGNPPYNFILNGNPLTGMTYEDLPAGTYTVEIFDADGCDWSETVEVDESITPLINVESSSTYCGENNGSIAIEALDGVAPFEYSIGNGFTTQQNHDNLSPEFYTVTMRDQEGCIATETIEIKSSRPIIHVIHIKDEDCGLSNGVVTIAAIDGVFPLRYFLTNEYDEVESHSGIFQYVSSGKYLITIKGTDGCVVTEEIFVDKNPGPVINSNVSHPNCAEKNGSIELDLTTSDNEPFNIYMSGNLIGDKIPASLFLIDSLADGLYDIIVEDNLGCSDQQEIELDEGRSIVSSLDIQHISCDEVSGSVAPVIQTPGDYTFSLDNTENLSGEFDNLNAGTYLYTAVDSLGCTFVQEITVLDSSFTSVMIQIFDTECGDTKDVVIRPRNGQPPFINYIDGKIHGSKYVSGLSAGSHLIEVKDANGCLYKEEIFIEGTSLLTYDIRYCKRSSNKNADGLLSIDAAGGEKPYTYQLNQFKNETGNFHNLEKLYYDLTIIDANGCELNTGIILCEDSVGEDKSESRNTSGDKYKLYPNPASNLLTIEYNSTGLQEDIVLKNVHGKIIRRIKSLPNEQLIQINISDLNSGIYFIQFTKSQKVLKWLKL